MAAGTTLEKLQVIIEASASGYKREMDKIRQKTKQVGDVVGKQMAKINNMIGKLNVSGTSKGFEDLTVKLKRQQEAVDKQTMRVDNLRRKILDLESGDAKNSTISGLEKQLKAAEKELAILDKQMQPLLDKLSVLDEQAEAGLTPHGMDEVIAQIDAINPKYQELEDTVDSIRRKLEEFRMNPSGTIEAQKLRSELELAEKKLDRLEDEAGQTERKIASMGEKSKSAKFSMEGWNNAVKKVSGVLTGVSAKVDKLLLGFRRTKNSVDACNQSVGKFSRGLGQIVNMMKFMILQNAFMAVLGSIGTGFQNLAQFSDETNASLSLLMSSLLQLRNAVAAAAAPLLNLLAPALNTIIQYAVSAVNAVGQLIAALTGKGTVLKAVGVNKDYAASLNATGAAAKNAAKEIKNATLGIDELNVIQAESNDSSESGSGIGASDMFEAVEVESKYKDLAEKIKELLGQFFAPLKEAWDREGQFVMESWRYALDEVWQLIKDIGRDFLTVWNQERTIQAFADILHIVGDIGMIIGNLAHGLDEAWNKNQTGLHILENIRNIFAVIVDNVRKAADYTVDWSEKLNFTPILEAFERFTASLEPVANALSGILTDFYTKVLLPLGQWTIEKGLPDLLAIFTQFNEIVDWEKLRENLDNFWEKLEPFAETVGEGLLIFIEDLSLLVADFVNSEALENFLDHLGEWMESVEPEDVANGIKSLAEGFLALKGAIVLFDAALAGLKIFSTMKTMGDKFGKVKEVIGLFVGFVSGIDFGKLFSSMSPESLAFLGIKLTDAVKDSWLDPFSWDNLVGDILRFFTDAWSTSIDGFIEVLSHPFQTFMDTLGGIFNWDETIALFNEAGSDMGDNLLQGLLKGAEATLWLVLEPINDLFKNIITAVLELFGIHSPSTVFYDIGANLIYGLLGGLQETWQQLLDWWNNSAIIVWWTEYIAPWFSMEKWYELGQGILDGISTRWTEINDWWANTAITVWWEEHVKPWFSLEKWQELLNNVKVSFETKWKETAAKWKTDITAWWNVDVKPWFTTEKWLGILANVKSAFSEAFNNVRSAVNEKMAAVYETVAGWVENILSVIGNIKNAISDTISAIKGAFSGGFSGGGVSFKVATAQAYATGGFPEKGSLFIANEAGPEMVGRIGSRSAVANTEQIVEGITAGVENGNMAVVDTLLRVVELLGVIADKDERIVFDTKEGLEALKEREARNGVVFT